ncbi:2-amino-3-carboxymuconate-6-semialdehyde decarboxylase [Corynespora cassiicola Philippines]|uniref:6-methylsalicylate decarboxylase n=1 Tax=Corynespora cassiicola Philippines TaxID=1448308 RepID=A0A2T2NW23_CORCC|nr:2-amino-3-carboxymuconate-6-semialdehyde decarboxylase [Corynespora cassiicola Philippines]
MPSKGTPLEDLEWPPQPPLNKIDTHHHIVPDFYAKAVADAGGDPSGWPTPGWSPETSISIMSRLGIQTAIVSVTAPGATILEGQASYDLARNLNNYAASLRDSHPSRFGFFVNLANILDTEAALEEIAYGFDTLKADGVILFTRYGDGHTYLGNPAIEPVWEELNRRKAVVFVHPTHPADLGRVNSHMPQPLIDYPHETTRTAFDMITSGTRTKYPNCSVILSHAGGTLPWIFSRVVEPMKRTPDAENQQTFGTTATKALADFRSFHYDLALSATSWNLRTIFELIPEDHITFGSDFPYTRNGSYPQFLDNLETYNMTDDLRDKVNFGNAVALFPRLA